MFDIINSAIKRNKPYVIKKLIKDIAERFDKQKFDPIEDPLGTTLTSPISYVKTYLQVYNELLEPIYGNKNPLNYIYKSIKSGFINEALIYACIMFNLYIKEILELDTLWLDDKFVKRIIRNNPPEEIFILKYILKRYNYEDLICFYKAYHNLSTDDIIVLYINSNYCNTFDDFYNIYNKLHNKEDYDLYRKVKSLQKIELSRNIREWLYRHKLCYYEKIKILILNK